MAEGPVEFAQHAAPSVLDVAAVVHLPQGGDVPFAANHPVLAQLQPEGAAQSERCALRLVADFGNRAVQVAGVQHHAAVEARQNFGLRRGGILLRKRGKAAHEYHKKNQKGL